MTPFQHVIGGVAAMLFLHAAWLMGSTENYQRRDGLFIFILVNIAFGVQAVTSQNWSLLVMSVCGVILHLRAWIKWDHYDEPNDICHHQTRRS